MTQSNGVQFTVLSDSTAPIRAGVEVEVYAHDNPNRLICTLGNRWDVTGLDEIRKPGGGSFKIHQSDPVLRAYPSALDVRNVVRLKVNHRTVAGFLISKKRATRASTGETADLAWHVSGEGLRAWLRDAVVYPRRGIKPKASGTRYFSFASERDTWYNHSNWITPKKIQKHSLDPNPGPWNTRPADWPDVPAAWWVWGQDQVGESPSAPTGFNYFRFEFYVPESVGTKSYSVFAAADNQFKGYIDGEEIVSGEELDSSSSTYRADFELGPGEHVLAFKVYNSSVSPAALIAALFRAGDAEAGTRSKLITFTGAGSVAALTIQKVALDQSEATATTRLNDARTALKAAQDDYDDYDGDNAKVLAAKQKAVDDAHAVVTAREIVLGDIESEIQNVSDALSFATQAEARNLVGWVVNPYPANPPGWTVGGIMIRLIREAQERGVRFPSYVNGTFSDTHDSSGKAWDTTFDWSFPVGTELYEVVERLEETSCDLWIDPDTLQMHLYKERGRNRTSQSASESPVIFSIGRNVLKAEEELVSDSRTLSS